MKAFDFEKAGLRKVAFKVGYFGEKYCGFQFSPDVNTVEGEIFKALLKSKLAPSVEHCKFARAGRTDKGVSGFGQVCSLFIRSIHPLSSIGWSNVLNNPTKIAENLETSNEMPYIDILNRILPSDIRILAWAPVRHEFDARFSCKFRKYKYFFRKNELDLKLMNEAANLFVGVHDCRNICKIDAQKADGPNYFIREIHESHIEEYGDYCAFVVKGRAFLWHQVRCMMSILFMVGQKLEQPSIVPWLLSVQGGRPAYEMASDIPLVLIDCGYENINWITNNAESGNFSNDKIEPLLGPNNSQSRMIRMWDREIDAAYLKIAQLRTLRNQYLEICQLTNDTLMPEKLKHKPVAKRIRCDSVEVVVEKLKEKKRLKMLED